MPNHNDIIVFSTAPCGSYCATGVIYRVDRPAGRGRFRFVNVDTGGSTYDPAWAVSRADWNPAS